MKNAFILAVLASACWAQSTPRCKVTFGVVVKDSLNNAQQGFSLKTEEWFQKKMAKKYPDVCYSRAAAPVVFFFAAKPDVYHGSRTVSQTGTITDTTPGSSTYGQQVATTESGQSVAYEVDYDRLFLSVEMEQPDGTWKVMHNFSGKTLHPTLYGFCTRNCHPTFAMIENAVQWLHNGGLTDSTQSVLP